jgi:hypothetical protein
MKELLFMLAILGGAVCIGVPLGFARALVAAGAAGAAGAAVWGRWCRRGRGAPGVAGAPGLSGPLGPPGRGGRRGCQVAGWGERADAILCGHFICAPRKLSILYTFGIFVHIMQTNYTSAEHRLHLIGQTTKNIQKTAKNIQLNAQTTKHIQKIYKINHLITPTTNTTGSISKRRHQMFNFTTPALHWPTYSAGPPTQLPTASTAAHRPTAGMARRTRTVRCRHGHQPARTGCSQPQAGLTPPTRLCRDFVATLSTNGHLVYKRRKK